MDARSSAGGGGHRNFSDCVLKIPFYCDHRFYKGKVQIIISQHNISIFIKIKIEDGNKI